jgi:tripartite ATP-independent transporter DctM subunit
MTEVIVGIIGLGVLVAFFLTGIELALAMIVVGFFGFGYLISFDAAFNMMAKDVFDTFESYNLTVVPLFILMGQIAFNAGIARRLYDTAHKFIGHIPGGLAIATVVGATVFKAISGSSVATAATFSSVAVPEMDRFGYSKKLSTGIVATVGTLGILLPPSVVLIIFGVITQQSIGKLFVAGIIPGLLIALFFVFVIVGWCKIDPSVGPKGKKFSWKDRLFSLPEVIWPIVIFLVIIGGLLNGFFTPTEAGSVGTFAVIVLSFAKRDINLRKTAKSVLESLVTATMVLFLLAGSAVLGHFLAVTKIPMLVSDWVVQLPIHRSIIIFFVTLIYLIGGSFIDDLAFMILATPVFFPAVLKLGYDPLWFGMMIAVTVMIGVVIPPVAINVFVVKNITKVPIGVVYRGVYPFLVSLVLCGILLFIFPQLATFLPSIFYK